MLETLPSSYFLTLFIFMVIAVWAGLKFKRGWSLPFLSVLLTFFFWYMIEPIYTPQEFVPFSEDIIFDAYIFSSVFLLAFLFFFVILSRSFRPKQSTMSATRHLASLGQQMPRRIDRFVVPLAFIWLILVAVGSLRLGGDVFQALFPLEGRAGPTMWQRAAGAGAGTSGFLVSAASYIYLLVCAIFGAMLPIARRNSTRILLIVLILLSWPYLFLQGSRNQTLIAVLPFVISFFLFGRAGMLAKFSLVVGAAIFVNFWFGVVMQMREEQVGITEIGSSDDNVHLGLNMASELCWILYFQQNGSFEPSWGGRYLAEVANFVPRAIWPNKPLVGIDYAMLRGFGTYRGTGGDIGVVATISTGFIGQGIANFGPLFGSAFAGFLMACWANFLWRLRRQGTLPRLLLFVLGLALTINLGRDITLLTLFPFVFGYLAVLMLEYLQKQRRLRRRRPHDHDAVWSGNGPSL